MAQFQVVGQAVWNWITLTANPPKVNHLKTVESGKKQGQGTFWG
jgi:hypothetical protein